MKTGFEKLLKQYLNKRYMHVYVSRISKTNGVLTKHVPLAHKEPENKKSFFQYMHSFRLQFELLVLPTSRTGNNRLKGTKNLT